MKPDVCFSETMPPDDHRVHRLMPLAPTVPQNDFATGSAAVSPRGPCFVHPGPPARISGWRMPALLGSPVGLARATDKPL